jgi:hypothetical protein
MLRTYDVAPHNVRETGTGPVGKGYNLADLADAFTRYLPPVADVAGYQPQPLHDPPPLSSDVTDVADVAAPPPPTDRDPPDNPPDLADP